MKPALLLKAALALFALPATMATPIHSTSDSIEVQVGRHVVFSYPGATVPSQLLDMVKQGIVGGIILFGENVDDNVAENMATIQDAFKQSPAYDGKPLLIVTDQEGGQVRRLPGGPYDSEKQIGESTDPEVAATNAGQQAASVLNGAGCNGNLAPVLGVYRSAGDFLDQYGRSYGNTSEIVGTCAGAFIKAQQAGGSVATAKHFPGLGAAGANANTDEEPVTIKLPLDELRSVDEAPYKNAIAAGVDMVMPSWALYPSLDTKNPSGLSKLWLQNELRQRLDFKGVTISDAIEAGALKSFGDDPERAVLASKAGMDIILASGRNFTQGQAIVNKLVSSLKSGDLTQSDFDAATQRILALRQKL